MPEPLELRLAERERRTTISRDALDTIERLQAQCPKAHDRLQRKAERRMVDAMIFQIAVVGLFASWALLGIGPALILLAGAMVNALLLFVIRRREAQRCAPMVGSERRIQ